MDLPESVAKFIDKHCIGTEPLLLGLSGGPDSLALFYALLLYRKKHNISFHIAHIDHGWRQESGYEGEQLRQLAKKAGIPFHLRKLNPDELEGNLEKACRLERYRFFSELSQKYSFQGILLGHHSDDQSETVLKRVLEGAHWSNFVGLKSETWINGLRILRPLLNRSKKDIYAFLNQIDVIPFEDATNQDERFLRARMRQTLFPWLNQTFGKNTQASLINLSQEMEEIRDFFDAGSKKLLSRVVEGPFGVFLDLKNYLPSTLLEIKYFLRSFSELHSLQLSRAQYQSCAQSLMSNAANQCYQNGKKRLFVDRQRLYLVDAHEFSDRSWSMECSPEVAESNYCSSSFIEVWQGNCKIWLPEGQYCLANWKDNLANKKKIDKWWTNHRVPAFLRAFFPLVCQGSVIMHEFLSGCRFYSIDSEQKKVRVCLSFSE
jgi:tRNA(Ile)-lysidine synthase